MTKLTQFLAALSAFAGIWVALLYIVAQESTFRTFVVLPLPFHVLVLFGIYSVFTVIYRTINFNDCPGAAKELLEQIQEAKSDLRSKGFKFE